MSLLLVLFISMSVTTSSTISVSAYPVEEVFDTDFDAYVENFIDTLCTPDDSVHMALINDTEIVHVKGYGAYPELDTVHLLGKLSQLFTVTAIMQLYEDGLIDILDNINDYLPYSLNNPNFPAYPIRIQYLLTGTSTLINTEDYWDLAMNETYPFEDMFYNLLHPSGDYYDSGQCWLDVDPPSIHYYISQIAFDLLAYIVEIVTTEDFSQYIADNILTPLGMTNTKLNYSEYDSSKLANQTILYNTPVHLPHTNYDGRGAIGWRTTIEDYVKFAYSFIHGVYDSTSILNSTSLDLIKTNYGNNYGFGLNLNWTMHQTGTERYDSLNSNVWNFPGQGSLGCYDEVLFNEKFGIVMLADAHAVLGDDQGVVNDFFEFIENAMLDLLREETTKTSFGILVVPVVFAFLATLIIQRRRTKN